MGNDGGDLTAVLADRFAALRHRLDEAGGQGVRVLAVTKGFGPEAWTAASAVGLTDVGENYAQEALAKSSAGTLGMLKLHFIGRLQSNKVKLLAPYIAVWQSVDRAEVADAIARRSPAARVFVQVNVSGQAQQGGCDMAKTDALVAHCQGAGLAVEGLMTIGRQGSDDDIATGFRWLRHTADRLGLVECSMGMSSDLEIAVGEGATMVRVGTALFGKRPELGAR
jgi:PLP dependent protein